MGAVDRTEDFRQCVKEAAEGMHLREAGMVQVVSALMMPPQVQPSHFTLEAVQALESVRQLQKLVVGCRREYLDPPRMTEADRDAVDQQFALLVKRCRQEIDALQAELTEEGAPNTHIAAHRQGMVLILTEQLGVLTRAIDRLRSARYQALLGGKNGGAGAERQGLRKTRGRGATHGALSQAAREKGIGRFQGDSAERDTMRGGEGGAAGAEGLGRKQQGMVLLEDEELLAEELRELAQSAQAVEARMLEISKLNHLFSVNVLQQAEQIEHLYNEAVAATTNIEKGNRELERALKSGSSSRIMLILFFFVLPLALLFYDWYDRKQGLLW